MHFFWIEFNLFSEYVAALPI